MKILEDISLKPYTSMHVGGGARYFVTVENTPDLLEALKFTREKNVPSFYLGTGSNILVSDRGFPGLVIKISILGKKLISETNEYLEYEVGAGENWDEFVKFAVEKNLYGIENMSHVPSSVGASVVQNIGCYGQEVSESVVSVQLIDTETSEEVIFQNTDMNFSYRKSRLNNGSDKGKYVVTSIIFRLSKKEVLNLSYGDIQKYFTDHPEIKPTLQTVRNAIISIRNSKFPYPDSPKNGSVGSFWKIDPVDENIYETIIKRMEVKGLLEKANEMKEKRNVFIVKQGYKLASGLFIEALGLKGKQVGGAKILETHAGIISNFTGKATAEDVFDLSKQVIDAVYKEFGVQMKIEPELVGDFFI